jgi:hypothetical protein
MAEKVFNLDPKTLDEWDLDKGKQAKDLSHLAARVYMATAEAVIHSIAQQFPTWLQNHQRAQEVTNGIRSEFISAFPGLKDHLDKVEPIALSFRAANPKATKEEAIKAVGEIVHATYGIPKVGAVPIAAAPVQPGVPQQAARAMVLPPAQLGSSGTPRSAAPVVPSANPFSSLYEAEQQYDD